MSTASTAIATGQERGYTLGELMVASVAREICGLRFADNRQGSLVSLQPCVEVDEVPANTRGNLKVSPSHPHPAEPTHEALAIREYDKEGFWTN